MTRPDDYDGWLTYRRAMDGRRPPASPLPPIEDDPPARTFWGRIGAFGRAVWMAARGM